MIDDSYVKAHQHSTGAVGGNQAEGTRQRRLTTKLHPAMDAHGMTVRMLDMAGTVADCTQAVELIEGIEAEHLLADQGYDTSKALAVARSRGMAPVLPSKGKPEGGAGV